MTTGSLHTGFLRSADTTPDAPALATPDREWTYEELLAAASAIAAAARERAGRGPATMGVLAGKGFAAHAGLLASSFLGATYVPLSPSAPVGRLEDAVRAAAPDVVVADPAVTALGEHLATDLVVADPDAAPEPPLPRAEIARATERAAYLLFTSGSTGRPKGVPISPSSIRAFVEGLRWTRAELGARFAQLVEPTFDVSLIATLGAWEVGGAVDVLDSRNLVLRPAAVLERRGVRVWVSVPSVANMLRRRGALTPGAFGGLRCSMFCGEPLVVEVAEAWASAAPGSPVVNLYGPTEATVAVLAHEWSPGRDGTRCVNGVVPIGHPLPGVRTVVLDEATGEPAVEGELCVGGVQTFAGYLGDDQRTAAAFVDVGGDRYYRTGDRVRVLDDGCHVFLGRLDDQVKVLGHRLELGEVEAAVRSLPGVVDCAAVAWPVVDHTARGVVAFVVGTADGARAALAERLPAYAVPTRVVRVDDLPLTANGKVDRRALRAMLDAGGES